MSDETPEPDEKTQADNFAALREQKEALEAELRPLRVEKAVREAGLDLDSPAGKAVSRILSTEETVDAEQVRNLAAELGFEDDPPKPEPTPKERTAQEFANRQSALNQVTTSDEPPNLQSQIAEAEQDGDWNKAVNLKLQMLTGQGG